MTDIKIVLSLSLISSALFLQACSLQQPSAANPSAIESPRHPQMTEQEAKVRAASYATNNGIEITKDYKVTAVWHENVGGNTVPYWSVHFFAPFTGIPDGDMTIWVEENGACKGTWER